MTPSRRSAPILTPLMAAMSRRWSTGAGLSTPPLRCQALPRCSRNCCRVVMRGRSRRCRLGRVTRADCAGTALCSAGGSRRFGIRRPGGRSSRCRCRRRPPGDSCAVCASSTRRCSAGAICLMRSRRPSRCRLVRVRCLAGSSRWPPGIGMCAGCARTEGWCAGATTQTARPRCRSTGSAPSPTTGRRRSWPGQRTHAP